MGNDWFRLYSEFMDDPKVQMMPEHMQRRLIMLFCERSRDVLVTLHETELAFHWRISVAELAETKKLFIEKGFITDEWEIVNWSKRQFVSDNSSDRTRRYRERMRTSQERHKNVTVTEPCDAVTKCDALDTDTDTEINTPPSRAREAEPQPEPPTREPAQSPHSVPERGYEFEGDEIPDGLPPLAYARGLIERCNLPDSFALQTAAAAAITAYAKQDAISPHRATAALIDLARDALRRGETVNRFWFEDAKWRAKTEDASGRSDGNRGAAVGRVQRSLAAWDRAAKRRGVSGVPDAVPPNAGLLSASGVR